VVLLAIGFARQSGSSHEAMRYAKVPSPGTTSTFSQPYVFFTV
jgi:hypothetical protein